MPCSTEDYSLPEPVSRTILPNQLVLPGFRGGASLDTASSLLDAASSSLDATSELAVAPNAGQGHLFPLPPPALLANEGLRKVSPTQRGASGHKIFIGHVMAEGLNVQENTDPGHAGDDCWVEGNWVQIKTTGSFLPDGRLQFYAGKRRRFDQYTEVDYFAFVISGLQDLHARVLVMEGGIVRNRWPGPAVQLYPSDFPRYPNLKMLHPVMAKVTEESLVPV